MSGFRDPEPAEVKARVHKLAIANALVGAPSLPLPLPKFGVDLRDVQAEGSGIDLILGSGNTAFACVHIAPNAAGGFEVATRETQPIAVRFRASTEKIRERLAVAITNEKWKTAKLHAKALRDLPTGVPLSHFRQLMEGIEPRQGLVRTGFGCNQDCGFCWQSRQWPGYSADQVRTWIEDLFAMGARDLTISGGEPTLDRALVSHVAHARSLGMRNVVIETNAIQLGKRPEFAAELKEAGLSRAFVSFHAADADVSDAMTRAPGTHAKTVAGIKALMRAEVHVIANAVVTRDTVNDLPNVPGFIKKHFGGSGWFGGLSISVPVLPYEYDLITKVIAEPEDVRESLRKTLDEAEKHGVLVFGMDGPCGPPLCAFGADRRATDLSPKGPVSFRTYVKECENCAVRGSCHGVQPDEYTLFGPRAVKPL
ncbi:MAG: radical SAM protein [Polyangiaceae bacterium]|nr:radical SAM protein [Polyangiaceae bacterium]